MTACDFLSFDEYFFWNFSHKNLPIVRATQIQWTMKKTVATECKNATESSGSTPLLIDQNIIFVANQREEILTLLKVVL